MSIVFRGLSIRTGSRLAASGQIDGRLAMTGQAIHRVMNPRLNNRIAGWLRAGQGVGAGWAGGKQGEV